MAQQPQSKLNPNVYPSITYDDPRQHLNHPLKFDVHEAYSIDLTTLLCKQCNVKILAWWLPRPPQEQPDEE